MSANIAAQAGESKVEEFTLVSNYGNKSITIGTFNELLITESILDNTVRAKCTFVDTGYGAGRNVSSTEKRDLNLTSAEKCSLIVTDGYGNKISFKDNYHLRVNHRSHIESSRGIVVTLDFYSEESIKNEWVETRVEKSFDGKIPNHVNDILKNILKTPKKVYVDPGLNNFVFTGKNEKPFFLCPWLAKRCMPSSGPPGKYAGYFFWEISDNGRGTGGYKFKSLDILTKQSPKAKLVYTDTSKLPPGYDTKILDHSFDSTIRLDDALKSGFFGETLLKTFSPYTNDYEETVFDDKDRMDRNNMMGLEVPKIWGLKPTRISSMILQDDVSNTGQNLEKQLEVSKGQYINYPVENIIRQANTRYNNIFAVRLSVTIPGRFDLHAGDIVLCDFPEVSSKVTKVVSETKSGLYMIVDVGHRISKNSCYTTLNLTRDSIYRKGS